jgi:hypothetical protein
MNRLLHALREWFVAQRADWTGGSGARTGFKDLILKDTDKSLRLLRTVVIALLVIQGLRSGGAVLYTGYLLRSMDAAASESPQRARPDQSETFKPILEKGVLGMPPPMLPLQLFGVLGETALVGNSPEQVQEYAVGAEVPGGEKLIRIGVEDIELEKEGKKRKLTVFPERKK